MPSEDNAAKLRAQTRRAYRLIHAARLYWTAMARVSFEDAPYVTDQDLLEVVNAFEGDEWLTLAQIAGITPPSKDTTQIAVDLLQVGAEFERTAATRTVPR